MNTDKDIQKNIETLQELNFEKLQSFYKTAQEYKDLNENVSNLIKQYKKDSETRDIETYDEDGKPITVKEKDLWDEVYYLGWEDDHRATIALKGKYPDLFNMLIDDKKKAIDFEKQQVETFGFTLNKMSPLDVFNLMSMVARFQFKLMKKNNEI